VNSLFKKDAYSQQDKAEMKSLLVELDIYFVNEHGAVRRKETSSPRWAWLRKNRGGFDRQPEDKTKDVEIIASGRDDWIGWVELAKEAVDETSTRMTAKVIAEGVNAEIIAVIEAEDRPSLLRFNEELLGEKYRHIMLVDGNDPRGIDVGLMTKSGFPIRTIRSNVDAEDAQGIVFSRDCPEYEVVTQSGTHLPTRARLASTSRSSAQSPRTRKSANGRPGGACRDARGGLRRSYARPGSCSRPTRRSFRCSACRSSSRRSSRRFWCPLLSSPRSWYFSRPLRKPPVAYRTASRAWLHTRRCSMSRCVTCFGPHEDR
jgi:hypothetical protein